MMRRHPKTQFVCLHVADSENLEYVSECLDSHPNMHVDIAARLSELGRQPRAARKFFDRYQDRILFATDGDGVNEPGFYEPYFRFLETDDEYFPLRARADSRRRAMADLRNLFRTRFCEKFTIRTRLACWASKPRMTGTLILRCHNGAPAAIRCDTSTRYARSYARRTPVYR